MNDRVKHGFRIGHRLGRISEYFISEQLRNSDPDTLRRARTVTHFSLALITAGIFYSIVYIGMGLIESAIQVTLASTIALINIRVLRRSSNLQLAATVLALVLFWILTELAVHQGGETSPSLYWYALMPVLATLLSGRRAGLIWTVVTIFAHCVFVLGRDFGIQYEQVLPESSQRFWRFLVLVGLQLVLMSFAYLFESAKSRALEKLQQQIQLVDNVINSLPGVFYLIDDDLAYVRWNRNLEVVSGYSAAEIASIDPLELTAPESRSHILHAIREVFDRGESAIEGELLSKSGNRIPYYFTGRRIELNGRPHLVGMGVDLTDKRKAENALRESEERYGLAISASNDGIWDWNLLTDETYYSTRHQELLGVRSGENLKHISYWSNRVHPDDRQKLNEAVDAHLETRAPFDIEYRLETTQQGYRWFRDKGQAIWDEGGRAIRMVGSITDITDQRQLQSTLKEQAEFATFKAEIGHALGHEPALGTMLDRCAQAIHRQLQAGFTCIWTLSDSQSNLELSAISGAPHCPEDTRLHRPDRNSAISRLAKRGRPELIQDVAQLAQLCDPAWAKREGIVAFVGYPLLVGDRLVGVIGVFSRQVISPSIVELLSSISHQLSLGIERQWAIQRQTATSERVQAANIELNTRQEELRSTMTELKSVNKALEEARRAAEAASKAKSAFLANMSHEIRTPMTAILGFADIMSDDRTDKLAFEDRQDAARTIKRNGEHLLAIINDILDLSKIEAGKLTVEMMNCSPRSIVEETVSLVKVKADEKGLSIHAEYTDDIPSVIHSDPTRLRQILTNLLGNAVKFSDMGEARIQVSHINGDSPRVRFDVYDSGLGMSAEQAGQLFEEFTQADNSVTRRFGGTGLGLSISRRLARLLGGDVVLVDSKPGEGSHFRAEVAALRQIVETENPPQPAKTSAASNNSKSELPQGLRILLAEDGPDNQKLISYHLRRAGAVVTLVENGKLAIDAVRNANASGERFDLILMDMQMPLMSGYEAAGTLRQTGCRTPIIALTANAMSGDRIKCLQAGCDDYATKPIDRDALFEAISRQISAMPVQSA